MKNVVTVTLSTALLLAAGCASKSGGFSPIDGATAQSAGGSLGDSAEGSAGSFGGPNGPSMLPAARRGRL